jgi:hypothetical protein
MSRRVATVISLKLRRRVMRPSMMTSGRGRAQRSLLPTFCGRLARAFFKRAA